MERKKASAELAVRTVQKQMQEGLGELTTKLQAEVPVFAALSAGMRPYSVAVDGIAERPLASSIPSPAAAGWGRPSIPEPSKELADLSDEAAFVDQSRLGIGGRIALLHARLPGEPLCHAEVLGAQPDHGPARLRQIERGRLLGPGHGPRQCPAGYRGPPYLVRRSLPARLLRHLPRSLRSGPDRSGDAIIASPAGLGDRAASGST